MLAPRSVYRRVAVPFGNQPEPPDCGLRADGLRLGWGRRGAGAPPRFEGAAEPTGPEPGLGRILGGLALFMGALGSSSAAAQQAESASAQQADSASAGPAQAQAQTNAPATTTTRSLFLPAPGSDPDAHLPSSSRSRLDINQGDTFDLRRPGRGAPTLKGDANALGAFGATARSASPGPANGLYVVRDGDTLWDICGAQFGDPHEWPRVWSYNSQLKNPHWIYPGDELLLQPGFTGLAMAGAPPGGQASGSSLTPAQAIAARSTGQARLPSETVFLRDLGYIADPSQQTWGEIVGASFERQLLSEGTEVYILLRPGVKVKPGQLMTVFRELREARDVPGARMPPGQIIAFRGTAKIRRYNPDTRMAQAELIESLDVIERGAKVGPIGRRFLVVSPAAAEVDLRGRVLTSLYPHLLLGGQQVVFIDRGRNDGLKPGNRLRVLRRGDAWRETLATSTEMARTRILMATPERGVQEVVELKGRTEDFPEEVIAELRVVRTHPFSSLAIVSESTREIEPGDEILAERGY